MRVSAALAHDGVQKEHVANVERDDVERGQNPARVGEARELDPFELIQTHASRVGVWGCLRAPPEAGLPGPTRPPPENLTGPVKLSGQGIWFSRHGAPGKRQDVARVTDDHRTFLLDTFSVDA